MPTEPRTWSMFAGRPSEARHGLYLHVHSHPRTVEAYGDTPTPVIAVEDPEGPYYGWIYADDPERGPCMVQPHKGMFSMQFAYGPS